MKEIIMRYKEYVKDFGLNIIASLIVTVMTSVIVNPILAARYSEEKYGTILTLCALVGVLSSTFGNALNNVKLINKSGQKENYNFLISSVSFLSALLMLVISLTLYHADIVTSFLLGIHVLFSTINLYYSVTYRINIDYVQNLRYSVVVSLAYIVGILLYYLCNIWVVIYICADIAGTLHLYKTSTLFRDPYGITNNMKEVLKKYIPLIVTSLFAQALLYLDRFIIYPLIGSGAVAVYSTASFFGKSVGIVMTPIASVLLSYYADKSAFMGRQVFWKINFTVLSISLIFTGISVLFSPIITRLIYPTLFDAAQQYLFMANLAAIINIMGTMTNPYVLRFCDSKWQITITGGYGVVYVILGVSLINYCGLYGFAIASIIANTVRLAIMYLVGSFAVEKITKG